MKAKLILLLSASLVSSAWCEPPKPKENFHWPGWEIPASAIKERSAISIVEDEAAESKRKVKGEDGQEKNLASALQARVSRRAIAKNVIYLAKTPIIKWKDIRPGIYRVSARAKYLGDPNVIGTPIQLAIHTTTGGFGGSQLFHSFDIGEEDEYAIVSYLYEIDPTLSKRLKARKARHSWHYGGYLHEVHPGYKLKEPPKRKPPEGLQVSINLPRTKYSSYSGMAHNSVRSVSIDWVKLDRIKPSPGLTVRHVRAEKRWLRPGGDQSFDIAIENFNDQPMTRKFVVLLENGIDNRKEIHSEDISLNTGEIKKINVPWKTTSETKHWGYKVLAELRNGGKVESVDHDMFSVHPAVYDVHVMGANYRMPHPYRERENLQNLMEVFAATPGDCAQVMPKEDQWFCGMSIIPQSFKIVRGTTDYNRSIGVATHMYLFAGGTGEAVMDMYIRRPEWFYSRLVATDEVYRIRRKTHEAIRKHDFNTGPFKMTKNPHIEVGINHWYPELMEKITNETIEFVKRSGYEGIRFDVGIFGPQSVRTVFGEQLPFKSEDMMKHGAKNFNYYKNALRKEYPGFEFGANMDTWAYLERVGRRNEDAPAPETFPEFIAFATAGGMFMDEGTMNAPFWKHYMNRFEDCLWSICQKRAVVRKYGGVYQLFSPHRDGKGYYAHDDIYFATLLIASGAYYIGKFAAAPYCDDSPGEFITRFSEFFRSKDLMPLEDAEDKIYVDSPEELWFADPSVWADVGNKRRYVIPLINPPVKERFRRNKSNELPPPIDEPFPIEVKMPDGYSKANAWMLTWEPRVAAKKLEVSIEDGTAKVQFPGIKLFRTLVMEFEN